MSKVLIIQESSRQTCVAESPEYLRIGIGDLTEGASEKLFAVWAAKKGLLEKAMPEMQIHSDCIAISLQRLTAEEVAAYRIFVEKLLDTVSARKWVVPARKRVDAEACEKYVFRIWMNQLGLKGAEYARVRRILIRNLDGCSAYSNQEKMNSYNRRRREVRQYVSKVANQSFIPL